MSTKELLTVEEVARAVGLSTKTIERCIDATAVNGAVRPFPGWKLLGRKRVVPRAALDRWIAGLPDA